MFDSRGSIENRSNNEFCAWGDDFNKAYVTQWISIIFFGFLNKGWVDIFVELVTESTFDKVRDYVEIAVDVKGGKWWFFDVVVEFYHFMSDDLVGFLNILVLVNSCEDTPSSPSSHCEVGKLKNKSYEDTEMIVRDLASIDLLRSKGVVVVLLDLGWLIIANLSEVLFGSGSAVHVVDGFCTFWSFTDQPEKFMIFVFDLMPWDIEVGVVVGLSSTSGNLNNFELVITWTGDSAEFVESAQGWSLGKLGKCKSDYCQEYDIFHI